MTLINLQNIHMRWGDGDVATDALVDVSLSIEAGEFVAITGRSGSGKSTLLNIVAGLVEPTAGSVRIAGDRVNHRDLAAVAELRRRHIGVVFQHFNLMPSLTAVENIALPLELDGMSAKDAIGLARDALGSVELERKAGSFADQLSGGEQQRIAIARALVGDRSILLADEPTGSVDARTGADLIAILRRRADLGAAVVMVTHDSIDAATADRVVHLRDGSISSDATLGSAEARR